MTSIQHTVLPPASNSINASQSGRAGSPSAAGTLSPSTTSLAQPTARSYANATKTSFSPPPAGSNISAPPATTGGYQHGNKESMNGRAPPPMAAPPVINNGAAAYGGAPPVIIDHSKQPSVTINAAGASGYMPNGGPAAPSNRPNISFGSLNVNGSPAIASSVPYQSQTSSLPPPQSNPRITSPANSPSPIPQPAASGGRPPSAFQGQGNSLSFGSMGGADSDSTRHMRGAPQGPLMPGQPMHIRRESSQSSDMGGAAMQFSQSQNRGNFMPGGRGRSYGPSYPQQMPYSPAQNYRPMPGQQRPGPNIPHHFQNQMGPHSNSPHQAPRSPGLPGSHPGTPQMQHMQMASNQQLQYPPSFHAYAQHLGPQQGQFGMQPPFDPNYGYYHVPYQQHPQYLGPGPPQSPHQFKQIPPIPHQQYAQGQYNQPPSQAMSRTSSQVSERPASSVGGAPHHQQSSMATSSQPTHTTSQSTSAAPSTSSNFTIPSKVKKGITIRNLDGEVVTFDKKPSPGTSVPQPQSPAIVSSVPTPPPLASSTASHTRSDSKNGKTAAEIKAEFQEQVKKGQADDKRIAEEENISATDEKADAEASITQKADGDAQSLREKAEDEAKTKLEKQEVETAAARDKEEAEKAQAEKVQAEETQAEKAQAEKAQAEKAQAEKAQAEAAAEKARLEAEKAQADDENAKSDADRAKSDETEKARLEKEEEERMIAELEAAEREEEDRERAYAEKKKRADAEQAVKDKETAVSSDNDMQRLEREAEAAEEAREREREKAQAADGEEPKPEDVQSDNENDFASLKKPTLGPGASAEAEVTTHVSAESAPTPTLQKTAMGGKPKPAALKLETAKSVEPAQPTPALQALKSARMLELRKETVAYPDGINSPNPALNQAGKRNGRLYDKEFLLQFQPAFKEKPSLDWDQRLKDTVTDSSDSSIPKSARTPASGMGSRGPSTRGPPPTAFPVGGMGAFGQINQPRTLPPGTTSEARFSASTRPAPGMSNIAPGYTPRPGAFPIGGPIGGRQPSMPTSTSNRAGNSQRGAKPGRVESQRDRKAIAQDNSKMPLTAGVDIRLPEISKGGWKPPSAGRAAMSTAATPAGHMAPDMVQRKVKSNLNKMTPERFEKIADQIGAIAAQSKDETDGRTLRQIIALTFEKACDEAHWASMYARFCKRMLEEMSPEIKDETIRDKNDQPVVGGPLFRKYLLNRCQEDFELGWEVNLPEKPEGQTEEAAMLSDEYYIAAAAKRKGLGLIQFIGELYKLGMLSIRIMHECVMKLLNFDGMPDESAVESLVKLLRTVGATMSTAEQGPPLINTYFERIDKIMTMSGLPSRMHFMLLDTVDLRKAGWHSKEDSKGPKTIQRIHEEAEIAQQQAAMERARQSTRGGQGQGGGRMGAGRGDARNFSGNNQMPPPDYNRNQVGSDDLKKLSLRGISSRQASQGPAKLGPTSMFAARSSSGRMGLGPGSALISRGDESSGSSRAASQKAEKKEEEPKTNANANAFSALAALDTGDGTEAVPSSSPPTTKVQPASDDRNSSKLAEQPRPDALAAGDS